VSRSVSIGPIYRAAGATARRMCGPRMGCRRRRIASRKRGSLDVGPRRLHRSRVRLSLVLTSALSLAVVSPVTVIAQQCPDGTPPPCRAQAPPAPSRISIAVLPFASRSPDTADVYLADGMAEEIGNHLTQMSRLQVKARGMVEWQWRRTADPLRTARALGVAWYVHGSVRHAAPQLVVNVELVRPATGEQVWARRFARPDRDLFAAQAEVAESVAVVVGGRLTPAERRAITRRPTRNKEAFRLYLLGNSLVRRRVQSEVRRAIAAYAEAVRRDPGFADAWAQIGLARVMQYHWVGWVEEVSKDSLRSLARAAAARALALEPASAEAWLAKAAVAMADGELWLAREALERSVALDSLNPEAWNAYGVLYTADVRGSLDLYEHAAPLFRRALALDPSLRNTWRLLARSAADAGRLAEAEALFDSALTYGEWLPPLYQRAYVRFVRGDDAGAVADLTEGERVEGVRHPELRAWVQVLLGDSAPARAVLEQLRRQPGMRVGLGGGHAGLATLLGLHDEAIAVLEQLRARVNPAEPRCSPTAACSASIDTWNTLHDPIFAPLRGNPRFQRLWAETRPRVPWLEGYH